MSNATQTTPSDTGQTPASDTAQVTPTAPLHIPPDEYHFQGGGITIDYQISVGQLGHLMTYQDSSRSLEFRGTEVMETEVAALGKVVSVTIVPGGTDSAATTFSVALPPVWEFSQPGSVHVETFGVTTIHNTSDGPFGLGQNATYTVTNLSGEATSYSVDDSNPSADV
jgi:hypothetical protein